MLRPRDDSRRRTDLTRVRSDVRGLSELVGLSLLIVIVVLGSVIVAATGLQALDGNKKAVAVSQGEKSLQQLDTQSSDVTLGFDGDASQVVDLQQTGTDGSYEVQREAWIRVEILNTSTDHTEAEVLNETMGSVVYRRDETTIAYEGGGVWRSDGDGAMMVSPPEYHFQDGTLTLPVVSVSGDPGLSGQVQVTRDGVPEQKFPNETASLTNRLTDGKVQITVHSNYYRAWGQYFEETSNAYVWYDHDAQEVNAVFLVLPGWGSLRSGIIATSGAGELSLVGSGSYVDSYNSSVGNYSVTKSKEGVVEAVGDVRLSSSAATIEGDVRSGGFVGVDNPGATIDGNVSWTDGFNNDGTVTGINESINGIGSIEPIDGFIELSVDILKTENDNDATGGVIQNDQLVIAPGGSAELGAGSYYLENMDLQGQQLTLNTTEGDIHIGVRDTMNLERKNGVGANINVVGDGVVRIYLLSADSVRVSVTGEGQRDVNLNVGTESTVTIPGDRSPQLRLYAPQDFSATIAGSNSDPAEFTGVVYAPGGRTGPSSVYLKHADFYGQILTGNLTLAQGGAAHYDLALQGIALPRSPTLDRLEFLHAAVHRVRLEDQ